MKIDISSMVGYSVGVPKDKQKDINYILAGNGAVEIRENEIAVFTTQSKKIPGLDDVKEGIQLKLPKIPSELLFQTIAFFKEVNRLHNSEAIIQIYWNRESKSYHIYCPKQTISGAAVDFKRNPEMDKKHLLVADIHSHNTMDAFFSGTDNNDEKEARLYGVIGKIEDAIPKILFRASTGHCVVDVPLDKVFNISTEYPQKWMKQIEKKKEFAITNGAELGGQDWWKGWDAKAGQFKNESRETEKWNGREWVAENASTDSLFPEVEQKERIDVIELRDQLVKNLSDEDKDFLATELLGSIQNTGGIDNGGYPIGNEML